MAELPAGPPSRHFAMKVQPLCRGEKVVCARVQKYRGDAVLRSGTARWSAGANSTDWKVGCRRPALAKAMCKDNKGSGWKDHLIM